MQNLRERILSPLPSKKNGGPCVIAGDPERLIFFAGEGYFLWRDRELYPPSGHALNLFKHLLAHRGHWRKKPELYHVLWPAADSGAIPDRADDIISINARRLASLLIGTGARIESRTWFGYRLVGEIDVV